MGIEESSPEELLVIMVKEETLWENLWQNAQEKVERV